MNEDINTIRDVLLDVSYARKDDESIEALLALRRLEKRLEHAVTPVDRSIPPPRIGTITPLNDPVSGPGQHHLAESEPVALGTIIVHHERDDAGYETPAMPNSALERICRNQPPGTRIEWHPALPKDPYRDDLTALPEGVIPACPDAGEVRTAWRKWRREIVDPIRKEQEERR